MTCTQFNKAKKTYGFNNLPQFVNIYKGWFNEKNGHYTSKNHVYCLSSIHNIKFSLDSVTIWFTDMYPKTTESTGKVLSIEVPRSQISYIE